MKYFVVLLISSVLLSCSKSNKSISIKNDSISDAEIYQALRIVLEELKASEELEGTTNYYVVDQLAMPIFKSESPNLAKSLETFFTAEDIKFIEKQIAEKPSFKIIQDSLIPKKLIAKYSLDSLRELSNNDKSKFIKDYNSKFGNIYFKSFSLPLFSIDKKTIYVDCNYYFGGSTIILNKVDGNWKSKHILMWTG